MRSFSCALTILAAFVAFGSHAHAADAAHPAKIRVLLTTGGHPFEIAPFYAMFDAMPDVQYTKAELPKDFGRLKPGLEKQFDVVVRYDMISKIPADQQQAFAELLKTGIGLVSLHHNLGAHREWPEFARIIGGKYVFQAAVYDGKKYAPSSYAHGQEIHVTVADKDHPITKGVCDFTIHDETYNGFYVASGVHVLLTTDHPKNTPQVAWVTKYGRSPVAYLMFGHDSQAYGNPNYARLVSNAIHWAAAGKPQ